MASMLRSAAAMGAGTILSRLFGLVRLQVFAIFFGAGAAMDAFNIAFRIPNLLRDLLAEGAMNSALVPSYVRAREEKGAAYAWGMARRVFSVLFVLVAILSALGIYFAEPLVELYASSYREIPGKFELTVLMTKVMFPFFPLVALAAAFMGVLNACGKFFIPSFASALFNVVSVVTGLILSTMVPKWGWHPIVGMAIGIVAGGLVQAAVQVPLLLQAGFRWTKRTASDPKWLRDPYLKQMLLLMIPGILGMAATQINILVNSILATSQESGAVSWLNYAFRLMQFPIGIFGVSLAAAALPLVSRSWVQGDRDSAAETLDRSIRSIFAISLPATMGLVFLGLPIVTLIFEYRSFDPTDSIATSRALVGYASGLVFYSMVKVLVPACYAMGCIRWAVGSSVGTVAATIALSLLWIGPYGYQGLAFATSAGALVQAVLLLWIVRRRLGSSQFLLPGRLVRTFGGYLLVSGAMGWICSTTMLELNQVWPDRLAEGWIPLARAIKVGLVVLEGILLILISSRVFGFKEVTEVLETLVKKLKKRAVTSKKVR